MTHWNSELTDDSALAQTAVAKLSGRAIQSSDRVLQREPPASSSPDSIATYHWVRPKEAAVLEEIKRLHSFCDRKQIQYAVFGGLATSAFLGFAHRPLHDVDIMLDAAGIAVIEQFLLKSHFTEKKTLASESADYKRFVKTTNFTEIHFQLFQPKFVIFDPCSVQLQRLWSLDFSEPLRRATARTVKTIDKANTFSVCVLPLEDLLASKLLPFFEASMFNDLLLLLMAVAPSAIDVEYLKSRFQSMPESIQLISIVNLDRFVSTISAQPLLKVLIDGSDLLATIDVLRQGLK